MKNELVIALINGVFDSLDATEIVLSMINKKIEYHELNSFSNLIKFNEKDVHLEDRIDALKKDRDLFIAYINSNKDKTFKIQSDIKVEIS
ncbi:MAG: hypothetical protein WCG90_03500 [Chitinophagia bacterium]